MQRLTTILRALSQAEVDFVIVGGVAVVVHGHARMTADLDLVIALDEANVTRAVATLEALGMSPRLPVPGSAFADAQQRQRWVKDRGLTVFTMLDPDDPLRVVDLFADPPIPYEALADRADRRVVAGVEVPVASIDDLIEMKRQAGRAIDLDDIRALEDGRDDGSDGS